MSVRRHPGAHDFDFLHGSWQIANERLRSRLTNSGDWERFEARASCAPILGGSGNVDSFSTRWQGIDFEGGSLRIFNPATALWSIYWFDNVGYQLLPPVIGGFTAGVGTFLGGDDHDGTSVRVRFTWSGITPDSARWEQAFSADRGQTWETNWIMHFTRT